MPSFTFVASVNAILYVGATPVFVDIEPETYTLDPGDLEHKITPKTKAVMAVDAFGHPIEWEDVLTIVERHGMVVIDDSAEALGAEYRGEKIGRFGTAAVFAFYPNKQVTTGEGGIVVTNDDDLARVVRSLRNQGRDPEHAWLQHERLGYNYRLNEMSAALGVSQLRRIDRMLSRRNHVAKMYTQRLSLLDLVQPPVVKPHVTMSWFVYVVTLADGLDRNALIHALERRAFPRGDTLVRFIFSRSFERGSTPSPGCCPSPNRWRNVPSRYRFTIASPKRRWTRWLQGLKKP